jgi:hypothetical protein
VTGGAPPAPRIGRGLLWFAVFNVVALACVAGLFALVLYGDFLDPVFAASHRAFFDREVIAVLAASMPFFASLLVGWGYARRAARRRAWQDGARAERERENDAGVLR